MSGSLKHESTKPYSFCEDSSKELFIHPTGIKVNIDSKSISNFFIKNISLFCFEAFCRRFSGNLSLFFCLILTCPFQRIRFLCLFSLWNINLPFFRGSLSCFSRRFISFPVRSPRSPRRRPFFSRRHLPSARLSILAQPLS